MRELSSVAEAFKRAWLLRRSEGDASHVTSAPNKEPSLEHGASADARAAELVRHLGDLAKNVLEVALRSLDRRPRHHERAHGPEGHFRSRGVVAGAPEGAFAVDDDELPLDAHP